MNTNIAAYNILPTIYQHEEIVQKDEETDLTPAKSQGKYIFF